MEKDRTIEPKDLVEGNLKDVFETPRQGRNAPEVLFEISKKLKQVWRRNKR